MKFLKTFLASILGTITALFLLGLISFFIVLSSSEDPEPYVRENSVLKFDLSGQIPARDNPNPFDKVFNPEKSDQTSLQELRANLEKAAVDDKISGVWLNVDFVSAPWATLQEARNMLEAYRDTTDKFLYASTSDMGYNEKGYYLATTADSIFSPPVSLFEFDGFYFQTAFYKKLFDKIGVDVQVFRKGKYKSAIEPYVRTEHSEESKYQMQQIVDQISGEYLSTTSSATGLSVDTLNQMLNDQPHFDASYAHENGLIHKLVYPGAMDSLIKKRVGIEQEDELHVVKSKRYAQVNPSTAGIPSPGGEHEIAVLYANGPIVPQSPTSSPLEQQQFITADSFKDKLKKIRERDDVKALVVRLNSPGGSASTSDVIWQMLRETSNEMPVIASMGPVAASGGYYIAMAADSIVAQPTTITGSIGVFGTKFNTQTLFNDKVGITFDRVKSHDHADWMNTNQSMSTDEERALQHYIDQFYQKFIGRVAQSRSLTKDQVHTRAQGRVWIGADAKKQKLVDVLGGLERSVGIAAERAGVTDYKMVEYPKPKKFFEMLMQSAETKAKSWMPDILYSQHTNSLQEALTYREGDPLTLMPYKITIE